MRGLNLVPPQGSICAGRPKMSMSRQKLASIFLVSMFRTCVVGVMVPWFLALWAHSRHALSLASASTLRTVLNHRIRYHRAPEPGSRSVAAAIGAGERSGYSGGAGAGFDFGVGCWNRVDHGVKTSASDRTLKRQRSLILSPRPNRSGTAGVVIVRIRTRSRSVIRER